MILSGNLRQTITQYKTFQLKIFVVAIFTVIISMNTSSQVNNVDQEDVCVWQLTGSAKLSCKIIINKNTIWIRIILINLEAGFALLC